MSTLTNDQFIVHLPKSASTDLQQDQEYFELEQGGQRRRLRFHDYGEIYSVPGLYEHLFEDKMQCRSPEVIADLLHKTLEEKKQNASDLRVLDFGAGNGMVGEELARIGVEHLVGVDMAPEAKDAVERDRPGLYEGYHAIDITKPGPDAEAALKAAKFNCLVCVAALGFGDIPPEAFTAALNLVSDDGWVAFNIRDHVAASDDPGGFAPLLEELKEKGQLVEHARVKYPHRVGLSGEELEYWAIVAQKQAV
ncbi:MAG: methyltransferase domain-containing protein [Solirubrobacterales bacterium]|nr:methyltransferase domain-containing protein [Solirubrobacterales bacterium]